MIDIKEIKLTPEARLLIDSQKGFDLEAFLTWWKNNRMAITTHNLIEWLVIQAGKKGGNNNDSKNS